MLLLIRIAAGDQQACALAEASTGEAVARVREAAVFYIQQVMFAADSHSYRVLGVDPDAGGEQLRENYRWLARWLHPDRNRDEWEAVYAERVSRAWQDLRTAERRSQYDQGRESFEPPAQPPLVVVPAHGRYIAAAEEAHGAGLDLRWLPAAILGGLGLLALVAVTLFYGVRWAESRAPAAAEPVAVAEPPSLPSALAHHAANVASHPIVAQDRAVGRAHPPAVAPVLLAAKLPVPAASSSKETHIPEPRAPLPKKPEAAIAAQPVVKAPLPSPPRAGAATAATSPQPVAVPAPAVARAQVARIAGTPRVIEPGSESSARAEPARPAAGQREANRFLGRFSRVYSAGDLDQMRAMFTADATSPDGGLESILSGYGRLFDNSEERLLAVRDVSWVARGDTFTIIASFRATVKAGHGRRVRETRGDLRMDLRQEDEQWRIYRLQQDERRG